MVELPVDIWWIILKKMWKSDCTLDFDPGNHKNYGNAKRSYLYYDQQTFNLVITNDLYMMRTLCKTTKKMVDKYSTRYVDGCEGENKRYYLIFPYE